VGAAVLPLTARSSARLLSTLRIKPRAFAILLSALVIFFVAALSALDAVEERGDPTSTPWLHSFSSSMRLTLFMSRRSAHDAPCK